MLEVGGMAAEDGVDILNTTTPEGMTLTEAKKELECVALVVNFRFCVLTQKPNKHKNEVKGGTQNRARERREPMRDESIVVIKTGEKSYADLLREMESSTEREFEVRKVVKTRGGDLALYMKRDGERTKKIRDTIVEKTGLKNIYGRDNKRRRTILISGIDTVTSKEEV